MRVKGVICAIALSAAAMLLTGCTALTRTSSQMQTDTTTAYSIADLVNDRYYVMHDSGEKDRDGNKIYEYRQLYIGETNFNTSGSTYQAGRVAWFRDDFDLIPTLYEGDRLVYKTTNPPAESYAFERFRYDGITMGISGISKRKSGRFYIDASASSMGTGVISRDSDAYKLYELNTNVAVIDTISGVKLEDGNISASGVILGLEQDSLDKDYETVIYAGSRKCDYFLRADRIALSSMESYTSDEYSYYDDSLIQIGIPASFNTGYYAIGGQGILRLVRGSSYTVNTEFNTPNGVPSDNTETRPTTDTEASETDLQVETLMIDMDGTYVIAIRYDDADILPSAKLITDTVAYTFTKAEDENALYATADLTAGTYHIEISGMEDSQYQVNFTQQ